MGNGARVVALAVGVYDLTLPSGLVFHLNNCYYVPDSCHSRCYEPTKFIPKLLLLS